MKQWQSFKRLYCIKYIISFKETGLRKKQVISNAWAARKENSLAKTEKGITCISEYSEVDECNIEPE